ncbi:SBBP repeat-containing protein [Ferruginibacter sp.]
MKSISSILFLLIAHCIALSQTAKLEWAKQMGGSSYDVCQAIVLDDNANVYATGYFSSTVDFDPGPTVYNLTSSAAEDIFISKSDAKGNLIWAKSIGDFRYQAGYAITLDAAKNIYITGIFFGSVDFDPGQGVSILNSAGNEDIFICKLDNNGNFIWAKKIGGATNDYCNAIVVDKFNNIYINGYFDGTADFDPENGVYNLTSKGQTDIYVCKLTNNGNLMWAKQIGGSGTESAYSIGLDDEQNVYSTGFFFASTDFDPGTAVVNLSATGFGDGFLLKLTQNGNYVNAFSIGSTEKVRCNNLKVDQKGRAVYITGYFDGAADFDPGTAVALLNSPAGNDDIFIAKYNLDQELIWVKQIVGSSFQKAYAMDVDITGNIYTTGHFNGTVDFDPGTANFNLTAFGDPSIFILKLDSTGNFIWAAQSGGEFYSSGYSIKVDTANNVFAAGTFNGIVDFDPGSEQYNLTTMGENEIFIQKLNQCNNAVITTALTIATCSAYTLNNKTYYNSGTYYQSIQNIMGCDSVVINLNLTITRVFENIFIDICQGQTWKASGKLQTKTGIYYDTVKNAAGCDSVIVTSLSVNSLPKPNLGINRNICQGQTINLDPGNFKSYLWQDSSTRKFFNAATPGTYKVAVTNQYNCTATASVILKKIVPPPLNFLPFDQPLCSGNVLKLSIPGYKNYLWSTSSQLNSVEIRQPGTYYLTVTSFDDCIGNDTIIINEIDCLPVNIPNAFSPNNDGINDFFKPVINIEIKEFHLKVFNRLGQQIFSSNLNNKAWNGNFKGLPQSSGTYVYQITFKNVTGKLFTYSGTVTLLR